MTGPCFVSSTRFCVFPFYHSSSGACVAVTPEQGCALDLEWKVEAKVDEQFNGRPHSRSVFLYSIMNGVTVFRGCQAVIGTLSHVLFSLASVQSLIPPVLDILILCFLSIPRRPSIIAIVLKNKSDGPRNRRRKSLPPCARAANQIEDPAAFQTRGTYSLLGSCTYPVCAHHTHLSSPKPVFLAPTMFLQDC